MSIQKASIRTTTEIHEMTSGQKMGWCMREMPEAFRAY
jgi:hypothetical protein